MASPVPRYAKSLVKTMRTDVAMEQRKTLPAVDTAEVVSLKGGVQIRPANVDIVYDEDDVLWNIDPDSLKVGDTVTMLRDPDENPIVTGLSDGMQPDPSLHPTHIKLRNEFDRLKSSAATWKAPVSTLANLPATGNKPGDIRLVGDLNQLYRWRITAGVGNWTALTSGSNVAYLDDLLDVVISAPAVGDTLVFDGTNFVNVAPGLGSDLVPTTVKSANYTATTADRVILCDTNAGNVSITLPVAPPNGLQIAVKWAIGANLLTVVGVIDGVVNFPFTIPNQAVTFHAFGGNWFVL
jgi:hypothetical protein